MVNESIGSVLCIVLNHTILVNINKLQQFFENFINILNREIKKNKILFNKIDIVKKEINKNKILLKKKKSNIPINEIKKKIYKNYFFILIFEESNTPKKLFLDYFLEMFEIINY